MSVRRVVIVTGTRAEYGLLRTVIGACESRDDLETVVLATGAHLLGPAHTIKEVERECERVFRVEMQRPGEGGRLDDARALGRGVAGMAEAFESLRPDAVVVLGDRIEALAGASAASVGGIVTVHLHGGDRAEGVADEAMRHAITKLAHLHLPASAGSAERIARMGEPEWRVRTVGSPAIDGLGKIDPCSGEDIREITSGEIDAVDAVFLMHPCGRDAEIEYRDAAAALTAFSGKRVVCLSPNSDAGREGIERAIRSACEREDGFVMIEHLERERFVGLLKHLSKASGVIVGNSSCALIECAAIGLGAVDVGTRQGGRERSANVIHVGAADTDAVATAIESARSRSGRIHDHPFGGGRTGEAVALILAELDLHDPRWLRKHNEY